MTQIAGKAEVHKLDPVWRQIREEARQILDADQSLGGFIYSAVLNHERFGQAIGHRLAILLANGDINAELIIQAYGAALKADPEIGQAARADILAVYERDPACERYIEPFLYFKGYQALQAHRLAHALWSMGRRDFALFLQGRSSAVLSVDIHPAARLGKGIMIDHGHSIVIGETAVVEDNVSILQDVTLGGTGKDEGDRHPKIREGVLLGAGCKVLGNIEVGRCAKVASGSVVLSDVPPRRTVAGVPARIVGYTGCEEEPSRVMDQNIGAAEEEES